MSGSAGFTLVELLVIVTIIGVIAFISIVTYNNFIQKARETNVIVYLRYVNRAEIEHQFINDSYTGKFNDLEETGSIPEGLGKTITKVGEKERILENYTITLDITPGNKWHARAEPVNKRADLRWFYIDETGVARFEYGEKANANSPRL